MCRYLKMYFCVKVLNCLFSIIFSLKYDLMKLVFRPPCPKLAGILSAYANLNAILSTGILSMYDKSRAPVLDR